MYTSENDADNFNEFINAGNDGKVMAPENVMQKVQHPLLPKSLQIHSDMVITCKL